MSAIPAIALALACVALLIAAEAWWLIRSMARRMATMDAMVTALCRCIISATEAAREEKLEAMEERKRVN